MKVGFDHVLVAVSDLDVAASDFRDRYGLESAEGGRHTGLGTANRVIPLGASYIELIAVVDQEEGAHSPLATWVNELCRDGDRPAAVCLRTDDIQSVAERLESPPLSMQRERPDGVTLRWKLSGLEATLQDPALPFFIQWDIDAGDFPGALTDDHPNRGIELAWVDVAGSEAELRERIGGDGPDLRVVPEGSGVVAIGLSTPNGPTVIR